MVDVIEYTTWLIKALGKELQVQKKTMPLQNRLIYLDRIKHVE